MKHLQIIILAIVLGALVGSGATLAIEKLMPESQADLISEFYEIENAVHVSPHSIRKAMDTGEMNFVLVDLRSQEEYEKEHVVGAVNIPAYKDKDNSDYGAVDRIVSSFAELKESNPGKDIIVYCYSMPCMTGRKIGAMLAENDIYVKHLNIGWNEWRYFWDLWNHEHELEQTDVEDYLASGKEPGTPKLKSGTSGCSVSKDFGC